MDHPGKQHKTKVEIYIEWFDETSSSISIPAGKYSTNYKYKAETEALQQAVRVLGNSECEATHNAKVIPLTDAKSVLQSMENNKSTELNALTRAIMAQNSSACRVVLQWIPGHVDIFGNECAGELARKREQMEQTPPSPNYQKAKTLIKPAIHAQWNEAHRQHRRKDPIYQLPRADQVIILRLRTGHNRLKHCMFSRFKTGDGPNCPY
ncbi:uncharacterized protein LOC101862106 [Aplysia californica]|uniref:Uncharacterized protein LOC101862106 n=1 Tax=Aplysia californica TaxID=6500 RepID=A0ABM0JK52_APLCA|nr:uncharacterized protein LOC101862106 [Aplysia californica]